MTYSNITALNVPPNISSHNIPKITKEKLLKIHICVAHTQLKNQERPGTYAEELNTVLNVNNLPNIIIPDDDAEQLVTGIMSYDTNQQLTPKEQQGLSRQSSADMTKAVAGRTSLLDYEESTEDYVTVCPTSIS
ncbi:hypothetical protein E2C01_037225 [Portunus trituberculatus]|uniref:Uncharacterized protein n=1 Tax=Portunus trituberculatus TaxID=210409 RepID=A0A5B7FE34_PORTR|nr:hypothetical protein [Portunus trituberculatus]